MWRWSWLWALFQTSKWVFSTYVEVILVMSSSAEMMSGFLHVCGGDPATYLRNLISNRFSPRMWRWSYNTQNALIFPHVFSTYVEVILCFVFGNISNVGFLHVCGGDPGCQPQALTVVVFSPRMWRWSRSCRSILMNFLVFSTYVEVILSFGWFLLLKSPFSPRMWRWSWNFTVDWVATFVFSTYVEVILSKTFNIFWVISFLHVCGGDPMILIYWREKLLFSPRMWRWS